MDLRVKTGIAETIVKGKVFKFSMSEGHPLNCWLLSVMKELGSTLVI
jgi:hypothetical protein